MTGYNEHGVHGPHTSDLDHRIAEALSRASEPYADEVDFTVHTRDETGRAVSFAAVAWRDGDHFYAAAETATEALAQAMDFITTHGGAS